MWSPKRKQDDLVRVAYRQGLLQESEPVHRLAHANVDAVHAAFAVCSPQQKAVGQLRSVEKVVQRRELAGVGQAKPVASVPRRGSVLRGVRPERPEVIPHTVVTRRVRHEYEAETDQLGTRHRTRWGNAEEAARIQPAC